MNNRKEKIRKPTCLGIPTLNQKEKTENGRQKEYKKMSQT